MALKVADTSRFPGWDGSIAGARALQTELAQRLRIEDDYPPLKVIAGVDVGFEDEGRTTRAVAVLLDAQSLQPLAEVLVRLPTNMPYVPGLLSFRELPALLAALEQLPQLPDLIYCDGHGIAHPRGLGIAAHLGIATGLPTIGVAKKVLVGTHAEPGPMPGDRAELLYRGEVIGSVLRSKAKIKPLIVSPGHRVSLARAPELVMACLRRHRLPEPTRLADHLASRRGAGQR